MRNKLDIDRMNQVAAELAEFLPVHASSGLPAEIADMLVRAREQVRLLPYALEDLAAARERFAVLDRAIDRLIRLALESADLDEDDEEGRSRRQDEFAELAHLVAEAAGRSEYAGPQLSILSRPQALAAYHTLKNLLPVKSTLAGQLDEQEQLIIQALAETIDFLQAVAAAYPDYESLSGISDLLERVEWVRVVYQAELGIGLVPKSGLH
jgi:cation transport regulator ChaB